jgi:hypothetical protein
MTEAKRYRNALRRGRFEFCVIKIGQTDALLAVESGAWSHGLAFAAAERVRRTREDLERYCQGHRAFRESYDPIPDDSGAPDIARAMAAAARSAGVGPMAAVAGAIADDLLDYMVAVSGAEEAYVENGGDVAIALSRPATVAVHTPTSALDGELALTLPPGRWGIATSSGRLGHSRSLGASDACVACCERASLADAWATRLGDATGSASDLPAAMRLAGADARLKAALCVAGGSVAYRGGLALSRLGRSV